METKKHISFILALIFSSVLVYGQNVNWEKVLNKANRDFNKGNLDKAMAGYKKLSEQTSDCPFAYYGMGDVYNAKEKYDSAIVCYFKAAEYKHPNSSSLYNEIGMCYLNKKDYDQALVYYNKALIFNSIYANNNIGWVYEMKKDYSKALEYYYKSMENQPEVSNAYFNAGNVCINLKKYKEAIQIYEGCLKKSKFQSSKARLYSELGFLYLTQKEQDKSEKNYTEAEKMYRKRIKSDMKNNIANLSDLLIYRKKYTEAEKIALMDTTLILAKLNLASALLLQGKYQEAKTLYMKYANDEEYKDGWLEDFEKFKDAGVIPEERKDDVERIRELLK